MSDAQTQPQNQTPTEDPDLADEPDYDSELGDEPDYDSELGPGADNDVELDEREQEQHDVDLDDDGRPEDDEEKEDDDKNRDEEADDDPRRGGQYVREEWEENAAPDDSTVVEYQRRDADALFLSGAPCPHTTCENRENPAEAAWIKLVSAIPVAGQVSNLTVVTTGTAAPGQDAIQSLVHQVRPDNPDHYALREISTRWQLFKEGFDEDPSTGIAPTLKAGLRVLSEHWQGTDFDAFAEQVEVVLANCASVCDDIGDLTTGAVGLLEQKADEFYGLQGGSSGELPYPAPLYWISDMARMYTDPFVHVRPPFRSGLCDVTDGCGHAGGLLGSLLELGGFNKDYVDEVADYVENQTQYYMEKFKNEKPPATREQCEAWARADANNEISSDIEPGVEDYESRSRIANEDVINRWENAEESAGTFTPEAKPSSPSSFREASDMYGGSYEGLDAGTGGFQPGDAPPSPDGGSGGGTGGGGGLEPPGGLSGGLASGGSTLGSGGSFPVGAASSTLEGGQQPGASGSASAGGARGMGMGGMMGGMGGGRGMNAEPQTEGEHRDWLEEDEEIWGIRAVEDDPYA